MPPTFVATPLAAQRLRFEYNIKIHKKQQKAPAKELFCCNSLSIRIVQVVLLGFGVLFFQHLHGLGQLALAAAALADEGADGLGQAAAEKGVQPLAHDGYAVGAEGDSGGVGVAAACLAALHPAFFLQPIEEIQHRGGFPARLGQTVADVPAGGGGLAGPEGQQHLLFGGREGLEGIRDAVHGVHLAQK